MTMTTTTPKKRIGLVRPSAAPVWADEGATDEDEEGQDDITGDAIDWRETELEIGPTPQKHGRVLGLFDCLSPAVGTASRAMEDGEEGDALVPGNTVKRSAADAFSTDGARRATRAPKVVKSPLKTPSFLRRQVIAIEEDGTTGRPRMLFPALPKRGLSTLISELREMEDNDEDEGMDVLREMESDYPPIDRPSVREDGRAEPAAAVTAETEPPGAEKVKWKKKGLKRSHRRVIMRPTVAKKGTSSSVGPDVASSAATAAADLDGDSDDEYVNSADEAADEVAARGATTDETVAASTTRTKSTAKPNKRAGGVSHNFKSLKLRNSGAKGGGGNRFNRGGGGGRFGGRR